EGPTMFTGPSEGRVVPDVHRPGGVRAAQIDGGEGGRQRGPRRSPLRRVNVPFPDRPGDTVRHRARREEPFYRPRLECGGGDENLPVARGRCREAWVGRRVDEY